jgi:hypothetical protein
VIRPRIITLLVAVAAASFAPDALAQQITKDEPSGSGTSKEQLEEQKNPIRGSIFLFDQSMTTQTAHLETTPQQSYVPLYELWFSLRPRYNFDDHWSLRGRFDYTKELTNNQDTTYYREDVFGDIWTDLVYSAKLDSIWKGTKGSLGLRALWPTSKASQANGTYITPGITAGANHTFELNGDAAPWLDNAHAGVSLAYLHPFTSGTTANDYGNFTYNRQNVDGFSFVSHELTGTTLVEHTFWAILDTGLQVTPKVSLTLDMVFINQWHYAPTTGTCVATATGCAPASTLPGMTDSQFTQNTWFIANVDYQLFDEIDLGLGYYNLANEIAPNGQNRSAFGPDNVWWSPDARVFFDITANLDKIYDDAIGHKYALKQAAQAARTQRIANELR